MRLSFRAALFIVVVDALAVWFAVRFCGCARSAEPSMAMKQDIGVRGLATDPSTLNEKLSGALSISSETVHRRSGTVEPRPGFRTGTGTDLAQLYKLLPFDDDMLSVGPTVLGNNTYWTASNDPVLAEDGATLVWVRDQIRACIARKKLYLTTGDRVRKLDDSSDLTAAGSGLEPPTIRRVNGNGGLGTAIANGATVSYGAIHERHYADGMIVRSARTALHVHTNDTGGADNPSVIIAWRNGIVWDEETNTGDRIRLYRSEQNDAGEADNELFQTRDFPVDNNIGDETLLDATPDAELGEKLYTSPSDEGIERANLRMPPCKDLAFFQKSLFGVNVTDYARIRVRFNGDGLVTGVDGVIGIRNITGTLTNGSAVMTAVSTSFTGLEVGMVITSAGATDFAGGGMIRITALNAGAGTVTFNQLWTGSTGGETVSVTDSIAINGVYFASGTPRTLIDHINNGSTVAEGRGVASAVAFAVGVGAVEFEGAVDNDVQKGTVAIEAFLATTTLQITASHGALYEPPLAAHGANPTELEPQPIPNAVVWSKSDAPEHWMLGALQRVGVETAANLRAFATRDSLWILQGKGGGLWQLSGADEVSGWRLDQKDPKLYLLHPELATEYKGVVYAWTNRGAVAISDAGVVELSAPLIGNLTAGMERDVDHENYVPATDPHVFCVSNDKDKEIIWGLPMIGDADRGRVFVFNVETQSWSTWFVGIDELSCAAYDGSSRELVFGRDDDSKPRIERIDGDVLHADASFAATILLVSDNTITLTGAVSGWTPAEGDMIAQGAVFALIVSVASSTVFTVRDATGLAAAGCTAYVAFESEIRWLPKASGAAAIMKRYSEILLHAESVFGLERWTLDLIASRDSTVTNSRLYIRALAGSSRVESSLEYRHLGTRNESYTSRLTVGVRIRQADTRFRLSGITTLYEPQSTQVNR